MSAAYDMDTQLSQSRVRDSEIDKHFADSWEIQPVGRLFEKVGIDRIWTHRQSGRRWTVEYKHDTLAHKTGNVFVETVSVDSAEKMGWAYTSGAQILVYYVVEGEYAFVVRMPEIERRLDYWQSFYQHKAATTVDKAANRSYKTWGVLVPLLTFRAISEKVMPVYNGDERAEKENVIPMRQGSGVLR